MKRLLKAIVFYTLFDLLIGGFCGGVMPLTPLAASQNYPAAASGKESRSVGQFYAANYAFGSGVVQSAQVQGGNSSTGSSSITVYVGYIALPDGRKIVPWSIIAPINVGGQSNVEKVTPTAISGCYPVDTSGATCTITASFSNLHNRGEAISSATFGLQEAINDAFASGGGSVVVDSQWAGLGGTTGMIIAAAPYADVSIADNRGPNFPPFWSLQPSTLTALATPAPRSASASGCTATHFVCDGTAVGTWTNAATYVCVTYVDILGGESPCSTTSNYTSAGSLAINFTAPVASAGAVGWRAYAGASYATAYQLPITSANCTLTALENVLPACAIANSTYGQLASNGVFPTPTTHTQIPPQAGGVAAAYNPNTQSHTTFAYQPSPRPGLGVQLSYGPFIVSGALTGGQSVVLGTVPLPAGTLNFIGSSLHISGDVTLTPSTGGTVGIDTEIGDFTDFSTGTPKAVCIEGETTASGTAAIKLHFDCSWTVNATGATGSIMPGGFILEQLQGGTTTGNLGVEQATAAITADVLDQDSIFIVFLQTTAAESTTPPQLLDLHVEVVPVS